MLLWQEHHAECKASVAASGGKVPAEQLLRQLLCAT